MIKRRERKTYLVNNLKDGLKTAKQLSKEGLWHETLNLYEQLYKQFPESDIQILELAYKEIRNAPSKDRYTLYQSRFFDFGIKDSEKVVDFGSGHLPFPLATHLVDFSTTDDSYGRAGVPFKNESNKPVYECNIEELPFKDKEFDFGYCSHVLEHVNSPEKACKEIIRTCKRGYIEVPARAADLFYHTALPSNHRWSVEVFDNRLIFKEYTPEEVQGLQTNLILRIHCTPRTTLERAIAALGILRGDCLNVMFAWENDFQYEVKRIQGN